MLNVIGCLLCQLSMSAVDQLMCAIISGISYQVLLVLVLARLLYRLPVSHDASVPGFIVVRLSQHCLQVFTDAGIF